VLQSLIVGRMGVSRVRAKDARCRKREDVETATKKSEESDTESEEEEQTRTESSTIEKQGPVIINLVPQFDFVLEL
jgi:predicted  nucleic acid-binding Zn-ribbon protein